MLSADRPTSRVVRLNSVRDGGFKLARFALPAGAVVEGAFLSLLEEPFSERFAVLRYPFDPHPNRRAHEVFAREVAAFLLPERRVPEAST